jgi:hypothetical protein
VSGVDFDRLVNAPCEKIFGVSANKGGKAHYTPPGGGDGVDVDGIYDESWRSVQVASGRHGMSMPVSTTSPCFGVRAAAFPSGTVPKQDGTLVLAQGRRFTIADVQPDGFDWFYLMLNEIT